MNKFILENFTNNDKINDTLRYFYNDTFFSCIVYYISIKHSYNELYNELIENDEAYAEVSFDFVIFGKCSLPPWELRKSVNYPLKLIIEEYRRNNPKIYSTTVDVIMPLVSEYGFDIFKSQHIVDEILDMSTHLHYDYLMEVAKNINAYFVNLKKKRSYRNYYLCDRLYNKKLSGRRESFRIVGKWLNIPEKSSHRRFYDIKREFKEKGLNIHDVLSGEEVIEINREIKRMQRFNMFKNNK